MTASRTEIASLLATALAACQVPSAQQTSEAGVTIGERDIGGVVASANGPEAGVWVIAETDELPTRYAKIVVTDDRGRYLIPEKGTRPKVAKFQLRPDPLAR